MKREKGREGKKTRKTYTTRPTHKKITCLLALHLGLREDKYYYLVVVTGCNRHCFHPPVQPGSQALHIRHMAYNSARKLAIDAGKSSAGGTTSRYLLKENQDHYVSKSSMHRLQALPQYRSEEPCEEEPNSSTATQLIDWLNRMATDPKSYLGYCILDHKKDGAEKVHKHPKGRPSK
jgi:hypothetical protein